MVCVTTRRCAICKAFFGSDGCVGAADKLGGENIVRVYVSDPLLDPRWTDLVERHDASSVFHTREWMEAVRRTYGYRPVLYTTTPPSSLQLSNGIVLCQIKSWLTGRRMVSVPFADHCQPFLDTPEAGVAIANELKKSLDFGKLKYIELRPLSELPEFDGTVKSLPYYFHMLDLRPSREELLRQTHKNCIQRRIRHAEGVGLVYECGNSEHLMNVFYRLMIQTRRRHQIPPQPIEWFRNLLGCMGEQLQIRVAFKGGQEIASILTLVHKNTIVYKYGCSDDAFNNLGGTPLLFWKAIVEAQDAGLTSMDFGRSDADNSGLISFKDRWGAKSSALTYVRWSRNKSATAATHRSSVVVKRLFGLMPDVLLQATGRILYRHVG